MEPVAFAAGAATVLAASQLVPQVARLWRATSVAGLSPSWAVLGLISNGGWVAYRSSQQLWLGVPSPAIAGALYLATLVLLVRLGPDRRVAASVGAAWLAGLIAVTVVGGWLALGVALGVSSLVQSAPSLWAALRTDSLAGVAVGVWWSGLGQAILWGFYGWHHGDAALMLYGVSTSVVAGVMLVRCRRRRDRRRQAPQPSLGLGR